MTEIITGEQFRDMMISGAAAIQNHREEINELNVFPVPDGDTGTNMSLTMGNGASALSQSSPGTIGRAADIAASALLRGARGNSGVILSLLFRGISKHLKDCDSADAVTLAASLQTGVAAAYKAVMKPAEGTILTVSRLAADAAMQKAEETDDIIAVLEYAIEVGKVALDNTVNQNPVLKKAGVVDAGGKGFLYVLGGMLSELKGERVVAEEQTEIKEKADFAGFETEDIRFTYCTEFIVERKTKREVNLLRDYLDARGDSIVVVDDDELIKVHVHSNEPGNILTEALKFGPLLTVKVENMKQQHTAKVVENETEDDTPAEPTKKYGIVTVCTGNGISSAFRDLGADGIITGGQTMNPSTEDILKKIEQTPAEIVFVLPNNKNIIMAAQQSIPLSTKKVVVIPTKTIPQGISALMVFDSEADEDANTAEMTAAAERVHTIQVTYAARDSEFDGHSIKAGEHLALLESTLLANGPQIDSVFESIEDAVKEFDPEFITVFYGADVTSEDAEELVSRLGKDMPNAEITSVSGGQPVYYYIISVE